MKETNSARDKNEVTEKNTLENFVFNGAGVNPPGNFSVPFNTIPMYFNPNGIPLPEYAYDCHLFTDIPSLPHEYTQFDNPFFPPPPNVSIPYAYIQKLDEKSTSLAQQNVIEVQDSSAEILSSFTVVETEERFDSLGDKKCSRIIQKDEIPSPRKIAEILRELQIAQREMNILRNNTTNFPAIKQERNRIASKICRLKKKAAYEINKLKSYHLEAEHNGLRSVIKEVSSFLLNNGTVPSFGKMYTNFYQTVCEKYLPSKQIAGNTDAHVEDILKSVALGKEQELYRSSRYNSP